MPVDASPHSSASSARRPTRLERVRAAAETLRTKLAAPGVSVAVRSSDETLAFAVGLADVATDAALTPGHRMLGGSTGKTFIAATAVKLAHEGAINLDAPLCDFVGAQAWFDTLPNADRLTLRRLLRHAGGVPDHMGLPEVLAELGAAMAREGPDAFLTPVQALAFIAGRAPIHPPGEGFFYSDTGFVLAGLTLEQALATPLYALVERCVLRPLGLRDTIPSVDRHIERLATPHFRTDTGFCAALAEDGGLMASPRTEWAGGGFATTPRDLADFIWAFASGRAFQQPYIAQVSDFNLFSWAPGHIGGYGLGVFGSQTRLGLALSHGGYFPGFQSLMSYFPDHDLAVAYQANVSEPFGSYSAIVENRVAAAALPPQPGSAFSMTSDGCVDLAEALLVDA